jgi:hypothetical protein
MLLDESIGAAEVSGEDIGLTELLEEQAENKKVEEKIIIRKSGFEIFICKFYIVKHSLYSVFPYLSRKTRIGKFTSKIKKDGRCVGLKNETQQFRALVVSIVRRQMRAYTAKLA